MSTMLESGTEENGDGSMFIPSPSSVELPGLPKLKKLQRAKTQYRQVNCPQAIVDRGNLLLIFLKEKFPPKFYNHVKESAASLTLWTRLSEAGYESAWGNGWNQGNGFELQNLYLPLRRIFSRERYSPLILSAAEAVLKRECVSLFGMMPVDEYCVPRFKVDGTFTFCYIYGVKEPKFGFSEKFITYQLAQFNGSGTVPKLIRHSDIRKLLDNGNSNVKLQSWPSRAREILYSANFLIVAGVHNHGGGGSNDGCWITLRPPVGETSWHLMVFGVTSTDSEQIPVTINRTAYVLAGGTYGVGKDGANITLNYLNALVEKNDD